MGKLWKVPVTWQMCGVVEIEADSLKEAVCRATNDDSIGLPEGNYVDSSFEVSYKNIEDIRSLYNKNQTDVDAAVALKNAGATVEQMCKVTFCRTAGADDSFQFDVYLSGISDDRFGEEGDIFLNADERIQAYDKAVCIVGDDAISDYSIMNAEGVYGVWVTVYRDTLGYPDDFDNLTDICVPAEWFIHNLDTAGQSLKDWFNEYTADSTDKLAADAKVNGVILECVDKTVDIYKLQPRYGELYNKNVLTEMSKEPPASSMKAVDIEWDVDNDDDLSLLPKEIKIPCGMEDPEEISDYLSDETGFCHKGFHLVKCEKSSLDALIQSASVRAAESQPASHVNSKEAFYEHK